MAYISFQPSDFFSTFLYSGSSDTSFTGEHIRTGVGFQPDMTVHKSRTGGGWWGWCDSVRGVVASAGTKAIYSNAANAEATSTTEYLDGYQSDGFKTGVNGSFGGDNNDFVSYCWKAGTTTGIAGSPSITPSSYSFNATSGFSIIAYTGNGTSGATLPHGLGVAPKMIIVKCLSAGEAWAVYHSAVDATAPEDKYMVLNTTAAAADHSEYWNDTSPTSTLFSVGNGGSVNNNTATYIAYCFAEKKGYSKFGSYIGTTDENADAAFCYCGFSPAWILIKANYASKPWMIFDNKREGYNPDNDVLLANSTAVETTTDYIDILSNGFKIRSTSTDINQDDVSYIWTAFAEFPIVSSNDVPCVAR